MCWACGAVRWEKEDMYVVWKNDLNICVYIAREGGGSRRMHVYMTLFGKAMSRTNFFGYELVTMLQKNFHVNITDILHNHIQSTTIIFPSSASQVSHLLSSPRPEELSDTLVRSWTIEFP